MTAAAKTATATAFDVIAASAFDASKPSSADTENAISDLWDDFADALFVAANSGIGSDYQIAAALYRRWSAAEQFQENGE